MSRHDVQSMLAALRADFLDAVPERCDQLEALILAIEKNWDQDKFEALFRHVHSLKGSGGTHGLGIISAICHHLENLLTEIQPSHQLTRASAVRALACADLLRQAEAEARQAKPSFTAIETELDRLRQQSLASRKAGLIAESSAAMSHFYQQVLSPLPVQLRIADNGLTALEHLLREPFDFVIVGRELRELNGVALISALRASQTRNQSIRAFLVTSRPDGIPAHAGFNAIILRDQHQATQLRSVVEQQVLHAGNTSE